MIEKFVNTFSPVSDIASRGHSVPGRWWRASGSGPVAPVSVPRRHRTDGPVFNRACVQRCPFVRNFLDFLQIIWRYQSSDTVHFSQIEAVVVWFSCYVDYLPVIKTNFDLEEKIENQMSYPKLHEKGWPWVHKWDNKFEGSRASRNPESWVHTNQTTTSSKAAKLVGTRSDNKLKDINLVGPQGPNQTQRILVGDSIAEISYLTSLAHYVHYLQTTTKHRWTDEISI